MASQAPSLHARGHSPAISPTPLLAAPHHQMCWTAFSLPSHWRFLSLLTIAFCDPGHSWGLWLLCSPLLLVWLLLQSIFPAPQVAPFM